MDAIKRFGRAAKQFYFRYQHGTWITVYLIFYLLGFTIVEHAGHRHYHVIHSMIDDMIPFCEYFIIPYYLWFAFVAVGILWFVFFCKSRREYYQLSSVLAIGMTAFLVVSCVFPNMQDLRPAVMEHQNVFTRMVEALYAADTPTNILPSIHVFNSLAIFFAFNSSEQMQKHKVVRASIGVLALLIILSTMFLKQHSVVDVSLGILMAVTVQKFCEFIFQGSRETYKNRYGERYLRG